MHASSDQARHCFNSGDYVCAKNIWEPLAYKGDSIAQFYMARINQEGLGVAKNISNAQIWYVEAAESGLLEAQNNLAVLYEKGDGLPRDINKAIKWYTLAAEQGDTSAQYNLALIYYTNEDVKDETKANSWFKKAAKLGDVQAQYNLALMLLNGLGVEAKPKRALRWLRRAADHGHILTADKC